MNAPAETSASRSSVVLALLAVYVIWGSTYLVMRVALEGFPPFVMAAIRFLLAGGGMYLFLRARGVPNPSLREWGWSAVIGTLMLAVGNGGVALAEQWVASSLAAVMVASMPLYAAFFAGLFGKWPARWEWAGLALGGVGVVFLNLDGDLRANLVGALALVASPLCWALGSVLSRRLPLPKGPMASAAQMLMGGLVLSVAGSFQWSHVAAHPPALKAWLAVLFLAVFGSVIGYSAYLFLLRAVRPALATSYAFVNPVVAVLLGLTLGGETITRLGVVGTLLIVSAVVLVAIGGAKRTRTPAPVIAPAPSASGAAAGSAIEASARTATTPRQAA